MRVNLTRIEISTLIYLLKSCSFVGVIRQKRAKMLIAKLQKAHSSF